MITQIPPNLVQDVFNNLPEETKEIILQMYQNEEMRDRILVDFSGGF
ncbi:MAG: hypothetical protein ACK4FL_01755 [Microgenomates group bacterium]